MRLSLEWQDYSSQIAGLRSTFFVQQPTSRIHAGQWLEQWRIAALVPSFIHTLRAFSTDLNLLIPKLSTALPTGVLECRCVIALACLVRTFKQA